MLEFIEENYLLSQYIPAGCTDVMQTCDTVADKPFKVGIKAASHPCNLLECIETVDNSLDKFQHFGILV